MKFASYTLLAFALQCQNAFSSARNEGLHRSDPLISHPMPPNPEPYRVTYDDGTESPLIRLRMVGEEEDPGHQIWEETLDGFTVTPSGGKYVYVDANEDSGELIETDLVVGVDDPHSSRIHKGAASMMKAAAAQEEIDVEIEVTEDDLRLRRNRRLQQGGILKNLVIPFKFSDHTSRPLPSRSNLNTLMNNVGPDPLCPTGSVRDAYLESSFNQLDIDSTVIDWVVLDYTQADCAGGQSGLTTGIHACLTNALDKAVAAGVDFSDYDLDNDGFIDGITFFHSGYAAEFGGTDQYGTGTNGRIWSHKWAIYTTNWQNNGVRVYEYHINPSVWSTSGSAIGRIGVVAHETGHFLGLPDLYDYGDGSGIGSWGLMANSWGFDGSQYRPPIMSAWSKNVLGWVSPTVVGSSGTFSLGQACDAPDMIRIDRGFPVGEYLLIENRQPCGFETAMPQGGLAIFHIDDNANNNRGYPGQAGWPDNNNHYEVAILQADGDYDLERGSGRGDSLDLFHAGGVNSIGPDGTSAGDVHPNTKPYLSSDYTEDIIISNISTAGSTMTFDITFGSGVTASPVPVTSTPTAAPTIVTSAPTKAPVPLTSAPTKAPTNASCGNGICEVDEGEGCGLCPSDCFSPTDCSMVSHPGSSLVYSSSSYGIVFDVAVGMKDLYFYGLKIYPYGTTTAKVYMKSGSFATDSDLNNWTKVFEGSISTASARQDIEFDTRFIGESLSTVAFYVSFGAGGAFIYSRDGMSNDDATVLVGNTLTQQTGETLPSTSFSNRAFYEGIRYDYGPSTTLAPVSSTSAPTASPTKSPTSSPTKAPTKSPTKSPTKTPTKTPTSSPTKSPTKSPTASNTVSPSATPSASPTKSPTKTPTSSPTKSPTKTPTKTPTSSPTKSPTASNTLPPSASPLASPTNSPTKSPTSSPTKSPVATPTPCTDRIGRWVINGKNKKWCRFAQNKPARTARRCQRFNLYADCPVTCGSCP